MTGWRARAVCADEVRAGRAEIDWWLPAGHDYTVDNLAALRICQRCPVADACLAEALAQSMFDDQVGIYGGTTPRARRRLRSGDATARVERARILTWAERRNTGHHEPPRRHLAVVR